jgi:signal transduction histidine kinase
MRLKPKMTLLLAVPVAAGMLALSLSIGLSVSHDVKELYLQMLDGIVEARAAEIGRWAQIYLKSVRMNALSSEFRSGDPSRIKPLLASNLSHLDRDQVDEFFATREGRYVSSSGSEGNIADRAYIKALLAGYADSIVSDGLVSRDTGKDIVVFAAAVRDEAGAIVGVSGTAVSLDTLSQIAASVRIGAGYGSILDGKLTVIAHPNFDYVMKLNIADPALAGFRGLEPAVALMRARQSGHQLYSDRPGERKFLVFAPVPFTTWSMAISVPLAQVNASAAKIMLILAALSITVLAALIASISISVDRIARPIASLSALARRVAEGELGFEGREAVVVDAPRDEVGELSWAFDAMARRLGDTLEGYDSVNRALAERNRDLEAAHDSLTLLNAQLEDRVMERTASLEAANEELERTLVALRDAQDKAEISAKMALLGRLATSIAHELNTPLGAIRSSASSACDEIEGIALVAMPAYPALPPERRQLFLALVRSGLTSARRLDLDEDSALKASAAERFKDSGVEKAASLAEDIATLDAFGMEDAVVDCVTSGDGAVVDMAVRLTELLRSEEIVLEAASKASATVGTLVRYSRLEDFEKNDDVYPAKEIEAILALQGEAVKRSVRVTLNFLSDDSVRGDRNALNQVWVNLINNALQSMEYRGSLAVEVRREGGDVLISFTDSGPGIQGPDKAKIFTPFYTTKKPGEGTGLGLNICKRIVELHGGTIGFDSRPGSTTFWVRLPARA